MTKKISITSNKIKLTIVGAGYVGYSLAVLLSKKHTVNILDISKKKIKDINSGKSPIFDKDINEKVLKNCSKIFATNEPNIALEDASYIIIATPTDYNDKNGMFDTSTVDDMVETSFNINPKALIIIKSTIPIGHTKKLQSKFKTNRIIYSPEFLREGSSLADNQNPSRIIVGGHCSKSKNFAEILKNSTNYPNKVKVLCTSSTEAEAVKLFSNTYLAMRVSFFNELDTFALAWGLDSKSIIDGVSLDHRIGDYYNNPSFGYGGYCLPKDTKQLLSNFKDIPQTIINAVVESNEIRKRFISEQILALNPKLVGLHRLIMKEGSDNFRESAILSILEILNDRGIEIIIYEPLIFDDVFRKFKVEKDIKKFKANSSVIIANRNTNILDDVKNKLFCRDLFGEN